jgi:hypothetical protein
LIAQHQDWRCRSASCRGNNLAYDLDSAHRLSRLDFSAQA